MKVGLASGLLALLAPASQGCTGPLLLDPCGAGPELQPSGGLMLMETVLFHSSPLGQNRLRRAGKVRKRMNREHRLLSLVLPRS